MIVRYCPVCYGENPEEASTCRHCGTLLAACSGEDYLAKLIWALGHPEPETRVRAATLLGRLGAAAAPAVNTLHRAYSASRDVHFRAAVAAACGAIGSADALALLAAALQDDSYIVRIAALEALRTLLEKGKTPDGRVWERVQWLAAGDPSAGVRETALALLASCPWLTGT
ncbi:MAG: HEAT repeat domain-containing protein [Desulfotomaculales bacterium]